MFRIALTIGGLAAALLLGGAGIPDPIPADELSAHQQVVAAEYRNRVHRAPVIFGSEILHDNEYLRCGYVTSKDEEGYITGWRLYTAFKLPDGTWRASISVLSECP
jgi:hypothetical protein